MNERIKTALAVVEARRDELLGTAANEVVRTKLKNLHDVCHHLVVTGRQRLTVPAVVATYAAHYPLKDQSIAESSIRNKRGGTNLYQMLYRAWEDVAEVILDAQPRRAAPVSGEIIDMDDVVAINDPAVRHQVKLLINQNRSLKSQLDILKQVRGAPVIKLTATHPDTKLLLQNQNDGCELNESEIAALADFLSERRLTARGLCIGEDGILENRGGAALSDPGLIDALRKILESQAGA